MTLRFHKIRLIKEGHAFVVDADIESYFDSIPHGRLMERVEERISDGRVLGLIRGWLDQDIVSGMERWTPTGGTPQGAVISPLLANIYLHPLDERLAAGGYRMVRYADDFVVLCQSREEAEAALAEIRRWVADNGLRLHPDKTHLGDCRRRGEGFEFLGYRFEAGHRFVRRKSVGRLKDGIRAKTRRTRGQSLTRIIDDLNPMLKGWYGYFQHAHPNTFRAMDPVCPQAASCRPAQAGPPPRPWPLPGRPSTLAQHFLRGCRVVRTLPGLACRETPPMRKPPTGEPYAGKPHVRFGGRGGLRPFPTPIDLGRENTIPLDRKPL